MLSKKKPQDRVDPEYLVGLDTASAQPAPTGVRPFIKKHWKPITAAICAAVVAAAVLVPKNSAKPTAASAQYVETRPEKRNIVNSYSADGTITAADTYTVRPMVKGSILTADFEVGDTVNKGDVLPIEISGSEAEAVSDKLVWHSADESIAHVSESGVLTAVGYGKTTISATDGNKAVTAKVTVMQNATAVSFSDVEMVIGERTLIRPSFEPVSATETDLTYSMDKEGVIEINEFGVMHALAEGSVIVTGTTAYGVSGQFTVTVKDDTNYGVESIALPATVKVGLNNKITLDVAFNPVNATNKNIKWYVEDDSIIRLTPGDAQAEIIGTKLGSTKVTAVSEDGGHVAECIVTVTEKEVGPPETGAVSMVLTGAMLVVAGIAVNMGKRRKKH